MKHLCWLISSMSLFSFCSSLNAGAMGTVEPTLKTGFFLGAGGSYNSIRYNATGEGILNVIDGPPPLGIFSAQTGSYAISKPAFSPEVQTGYFQRLNQSNWLLGIEFLYQYSRIKKTSYNRGTRLNLINAAANTSDVLQSNGLQLKVNDELILPVFIGRFFKQSFLYLGGGPSVFKTRYKAYSSSDTLSAYYIGDLDGFSRSRWLWGGAVQTGYAYYLSSSWFIKINYTYSVTGQNTIDKTRGFSSELNNGLNDGSIAMRTSYRIIAHEGAISLNKVFME
ncbi:MAG: hypothetical protein QM652_04115 [Legionella sp.]|uniref:outer membrane protein n=1 Tax=Legionella sp. TaxID=459 RepID=UPI0039E3142A